MTKKIIICTGSREFTDEASVRRYFATDEPAIVYHGDCRIKGKPADADAIVDKVARELGHEVRAFPVDHKLDGPWPGAGPRRSRRMVEAAVADCESLSCSITGLAFEKASAGNRGTRSCCQIMNEYDVGYWTVTER